MLVVVECLPETDPDVEQSQPAAETAEKSVSYDGAQCREGKQQVVVRPLGRPGQNDQQHPCHGADQDKQKDGRPVHPQLDEPRPILPGIQENRGRIG